MASGLDAIRAQLKKIGAVELAILGTALTSTEGKVKAIAKAVKDIALFRLIPITASLAGALLGVRGIVQSIVRESGALEAVWQRMARLKLYQGQLEPLVKSAAAARARLAELIQLSTGSRFNLGAWVGAARTLDILSRSALTGNANLRLAENAARTTGSGMAEMAGSIGEAYRALQEGQPAAQAAGALEQMGLVTAQTVAEVTRLQESGASLAEQWAAMEGAIRANSAATEDYASSAEGLTKRLDEARSAMLAAFGQPFEHGERQAMENSIAVAESLTPVMQTLGQTLSVVVEAGHNFAGGLTRSAAAVPGLSTAVGLLAKGFVALGAAAVVFGSGAMLASLATVGGALLSVAKAMNTTTLAQLLLQRASAATAAGQFVLAGALTAGANAATRVSLAANTATASVRTFLATLVTNPIGLLVLALTAAVAVFWQWRERVAEQTKALRELQDANRGVEQGISSQVGAIRTMDDAQKALLDTTNALIEARKKLAALEKDKNATPAQVAEARRHAAALARNQTGQERGLARHAPGAAAEEALRARAEQQVALDRLQRDNAIEQATGPQRVRMLRAEAARQAGEAAEAGLYQREKARIGGIEATAASTGKLGYRLDAIDAKRSSPSALIREEQRVQEMGRDPRFNAAQVAAAQRELSVRRGTVLAGADRNAAGAARLTNQADSEERMNRLREIGLDGAREETRLRSEGLTRAEQESEIRMKAAEAERDAASARNDTPEMQAAQNRLDAERQSLELTRKRAALQREMDALHMQVLERETAALNLASAGRFSEAAKAQKAALAASDAGTNKESYQRKLETMSPEEARAAVAREQAQREAARAARATAFSAEKDLELRQREAALGGNGREAARLQDTQRVRGYLSEGLQAGLTGEALSGYAQRAASTDLREQMQTAARESMAVSSLARIGGGGNVSGGDAMKALAQRQADLLEIIAKNTGGDNGGIK